MAQRTYTADGSRGVLLVDWPLFGELSRALALKVAREYDPEIVIGIATAGVVPGAAVAAILDLPFYSIMVSRRYRAETVRSTPAVFVTLCCTALRTVCAAAAASTIARKAPAPAFSSMEDGTPDEP